MTVLLLATLATKATLVLGLGFLIARLLKGASAGTRHLVWTATLVALIALPAAQPLPPLRLPWLPAADQAASAGLDDALTASSAEARAEGERRALGEVGDLHRSDRTSTIAVVLGAVYLSGTFAVIAHLLLGMARARRLTRDAVALTPDPSWPELAAEAATGRRSSRGPRLLTSAALPVPVTWGLVRPVVVLPGDFGDWDRRHRHNALLHELAHVERGDWAVQTLARVACALFWFHPLVWVAAHRLALEAELACDDRVLAAGAPSATYAEQLLTLAKRARLTRMPVAGTPMARPGQLAQRIHSVLQPRPGRPTMSRSRTFAVLTLTLAPMLLIAPARLVPAATSDGERGIDYRGDESRESPLLVAARNGDIRAVDALAAAGADLDAVSPGDGTPLIVAAANGDLAMVRELIDLGADVDAAAPGDGNPLIVAARDGHLEVARLLVEHGADIEHVVPRDENPLIRAAGEGHLEIVRYLIDLGADVNARVLANPGEYRTPLGQARGGGHRAVVELLRGAGATE